MNQEDKDDWQMEDLLVAACETENPNDPQVYSEVKIRLALITAIAYGRQHPDKDMLERFAEFLFEKELRGIFQTKLLVDQFLQSEANNKGE